MAGLTDQERQEILSRRQAPGALPAGVPTGAYPTSYTHKGLRMNFPQPPGMAEQELSQKEDSATRRQLLKKAADQKLQLEQGIALFNKIFDEAESDIPVIEKPAGTLPAQRVGRWAGRELGLREKQRGTLSSLRARATPSLKSLGEVGVLTNQDIDRILKGGFPSDDDTDVSRSQKRIGLVTDLQMKLEKVNEALGQTGTRQTDRTPEEDPLGLR